MAKESEGVFGLTRRNSLSLVNGVAIGALIGFPLIIEPNYRENRESEVFEADASGHMREAVEVLSEREYENYETDFENVTKSLSPQTGTARLNIGVESGKTNSQNLADQLAQGEYLDEAAEIFGVYAKNMLETEGLEYLELGFENGILKGSVWYEVEVGDIDPEVDTEDELSQFYRDTVRTNMRTG
jgi:hypothetical protein